MGSDDRRIVLGIAAVTLGFVALAWTQLAYATFDAELARLSGIEVGWLESALLALLTGVVGWAMLTGVLGVSLGIVVAHRFEWPKGAAICCCSPRSSRSCAARRASGAHGTQSARNALRMRERRCARRRRQVRVIAADQRTCTAWRARHATC